LKDEAAAAEKSTTIPSTNDSNTDAPNAKLHSAMKVFAITNHTFAMQLSYFSLLHFHYVVKPLTIVLRFFEVAHSTTTSEGSSPSHGHCACVAHYRRLQSSLLDSIFLTTE
jgi:hypothetical protein